VIGRYAAGLWLFWSIFEKKRFLFGQKAVAEKRKRGNPVVLEPIGSRVLVNYRSGLRFVGQKAAGSTHD
jgi:hypothetical protein